MRKVTHVKLLHLHKTCEGKVVTNDPSHYMVFKNKFKDSLIKGAWHWNVILNLSRFNDNFKETNDF